MNSIHSRRKATRKVKTSPTPANIENLCIVRAKTRRTIKSTKHKSWQSFVSKISSRTFIKKVWTMVCKITGKRFASQVQHLTLTMLPFIWSPPPETTIFCRMLSVHSLQDLYLCNYNKSSAGGRRPLYRRAAPVAAQTRRAAPVPDRCTDAPRWPLYRRSKVAKYFAPRKWTNASCISGIG